MSLGEDILTEGQAATAFVWEKTIVASAGQSFPAKLREMDPLTIESMFGDDPREFICIHGAKPIPALTMNQVVTIEGARLKIVKTPLDNPGSPFWEAYAVKVVPGVDS